MRATWRRSVPPGLPIRLPPDPKNYRCLTTQVPLFVRCGSRPASSDAPRHEREPKGHDGEPDDQSDLRRRQGDLNSIIADEFTFHLRAPIATAGDHAGVEDLLGVIGAIFEATNGDVKLEHQFFIGTDGWAAEWEHTVLGRHGKTLESKNAFVYGFTGDRFAEMWMFVGATRPGRGVLRLTQRCCGRSRTSPCCIDRTGSVVAWDDE